MRSSAIIGYVGKGLFNTPRKIDNIKDLYTTFGKRSNLIASAEQLLYADINPIVVRLEEVALTASASFVDDNNDLCMEVSADSPGITGCATTVEIARNGDSFSILVLNNGEMVEFWGNLKPEQAEEVVNFASKWINISIRRNSLPKVSVVELRMQKGAKSLPLTLGMVLKAIKSTEHLDVEFISLPDCDSWEIINGVLEYLEEDRPDLILAIDPPWECDLLQTYKWCKNLIPSEQGIIFWPWLNYERKSVPPSGPILAALMNWPFVWKPIRTKLAGVSDAVFSIHHDELAYLSKQEHFINIINKKNESLLLDTNILTLSGSKLSHRRLVNYIKNKISRLGIELLSAHNPVSNNFRNNFIESSEYILSQIKDDQGLNNYVLLVNELANPDDFEVDVELAIRDSVEIVNICFKFTK